MYSTAPRRDGLLVEIVGREQAGDAEVGVHRALGVRRDDDDAPTRRRGGVRRSGPEGHADGVEIVPEDGAQLVVGDLAEVRGAAAEAGEAAHRVGRRPTAHLDGGSERPVQVHGAVGVDQLHRPLDEPVVGEERVVGVGDDIDQGIADADHIELGLGHDRQRYRRRAGARVPGCGARTRRVPLPG
jgi:hypothetical protein